MKHLHKDSGNAADAMTSNSLQDDETDVSTVLLPQGNFYGSTSAGTASTANDPGSCRIIDPSSSYFSIHDVVAAAAAADWEEPQEFWWKRLWDYHNTRQFALDWSLYVNVIITICKFVAYIQTHSLSVLAALLDSVLDVVSQCILYYTEQRHTASQKRSSAQYPAGAAKLEPLAVLTCAALMGMGSFEVIKESITKLVVSSSWHDSKKDVAATDDSSSSNVMISFWSMLAIVIVKIILLQLCYAGARRRRTTIPIINSSTALVTAAKESTEELLSKKQAAVDDDDQNHDDPATNTDEDNATVDGGTSIGYDCSERSIMTLADSMRHEIRIHSTYDMKEGDSTPKATGGGNADFTRQPEQQHDDEPSEPSVVADSILEALALDHWNDALSNSVAAVALLCTILRPGLWCLDPTFAILISLYIIYAWYTTGREQIEHLTGRSAPPYFIQDIVSQANDFDDRMVVDTVRAYHFGPKFLVEIEVVMDSQTLLFESHDLGMELQYEIEGLDDVERCFVHIDYERRPYDEHVVSKVPELREKFLLHREKSVRSTNSV